MEHYQVRLILVVVLDGTFHEIHERRLLGNIPQNDKNSLLQYSINLENRLAAQNVYFYLTFVFFLILWNATKGLKWFPTNTKHIKVFKEIM